MVQAAHMHKLVATLAAAARLGCHCSKTMSVSSLLKPAILCLYLLQSAYINVQGHAAGCSLWWSSAEVGSVADCKLCGCCSVWKRLAPIRC